MAAEKMAENRINPELALRILRTVPIPEAFLFFTDIGQYTGELAACLTDFLKKLDEIPLKSIEFHFERGDFERWIKKSIGDENLADRIGKICRPVQGEELRKTIHEMVENRLKKLKEATMTDPSILKG